MKTHEPFIVADNCRGIYQMQHFAEWAVANLDETDTVGFDNLLNGPSDNLYDEVGNDVLNTTFHLNSHNWRVCVGPCGDLFMVPEEQAEKWTNE